MTAKGIRIVHPALPVKRISELVALGRRRQGELEYGTYGTGVEPSP